MATSQSFFSTLKRCIATIVPGDTTALKTVATGATNGSIVTSLVIASDDTATRDVTWGVTKNGGTFAPEATKTIPITAGTVASTPPVDMFDPAVSPGLPTDERGNPYVILESGDTLQVKSLSTVTTAKTISIHADQRSA